MAKVAANISYRVFIIEDEKPVRDSIQMLVQSFGYSTQSYESANQFFEDLNENSQGCMLVDVKLPGISGIQLLEKLKGMGIDIPLIVMTGLSTVPIAVEAYEKGAFAFIEKNKIAAGLKKLLHLAMEKGRDVAETSELRKLLTKRELEVLKLVSNGKTNKEIGDNLDISSRTAETHRANISRKLGAKSPADVIAFAIKIGLREPG